jgi:hypothetical protein
MCFPPRNQCQMLFHFDDPPSYADHTDQRCDGLPTSVTRLVNHRCGAGVFVAVR